MLGHGVGHSGHGFWGGHTGGFTVGHGGHTDGFTRGHVGHDDGFSVEHDGFSVEHVGGVVVGAHFFFGGREQDANPSLLFVNSSLANTGLVLCTTMPIIKVTMRIIATT